VMEDGSVTLSREVQSSKVQSRSEVMVAMMVICFREVSPRKAPRGRNVTFAGTTISSTSFGIFTSGFGIFTSGL